MPVAVLTCRQNLPRRWTTSDRHHKKSCLSTFDRESYAMRSACHRCHLTGRRTRAMHGRGKAPDIVARHRGKPSSRTRNTSAEVLMLTFRSGGTALPRAHVKVRAFEARGKGIGQSAAQPSTAAEVQSKLFTHRIRDCSVQDPVH
jgi:hypothetical protein